MEEVVETKQTRYRINITTTTKGVKTYDCTVEMTGVTKEEVLAESDALVSALDLRYPAPVEVK